MSRLVTFIVAVSVCLTAAISGPLHAKTLPAVTAQRPGATSQPSAQSAPASRAAITPIQAEVIEVAGRAYWAPVGTPVTQADAWKPVKVGDRYDAGTLIRTSLSSRVVLQFGKEEPYTVVMVERLTLAAIADLYKTQTEKVSKVVLSYGAIRGGVTEGGLRSSFVIDSTVATLTKRGTWDFRMFLERGTGRFEISLADRGLVEAINKLTRQRQTVRTGQYVTEAMRRWVEQARFDRLVPLQDLIGMTGVEVLYKAFHDSGLAALDPGSGANLLQQAKPGLQKLISARLKLAQQQQKQQIIRTVLQKTRLPRVIMRREGDFIATFAPTLSVR